MCARPIRALSFGCDASQVPMTCVLSSSFDFAIVRRSGGRAEPLAAGAEAGAARAPASSATGAAEPTAANPKIASARPFIRSEARSRPRNLLLEQALLEELLQVHLEGLHRVRMRPLL